VSGQLAEAGQRSHGVVVVVQYRDFHEPSFSRFRSRLPSRLAPGGSAAMSRFEIPTDDS
jgi:hypothetical protein